MDEIELSVVLPAYNEGEKLAAALSATDAYLAQTGIAYEIVAVNDGSGDHTLSVMESFAASHPSVRIITSGVNRGKGYAVKAGMLAAKGEYRFFFDVDMAVPMDTIATFLTAHREANADVVIGTRKTKASVITQRQPFYREILGKGFSRLTNVILGTSYSDITCGFKSFSRAASMRIFGEQKTMRWSFDAEILFLAKRSGFSVTEVPVTWKNDPHTKVRVLRDIALSLWELIRIRLMYL